MARDTLGVERNFRMAQNRRTLPPEVPLRVSRTNCYPNPMGTAGTDSHQRSVPNQSAVHTQTSIDFVLMPKMELSGLTETLAPKAESRKPKAESRKPKAEHFVTPFPWEFHLQPVFCQSKARKLYWNLTPIDIFVQHEVRVIWRHEKRHDHGR